MMPDDIIRDPSTGHQIAYADASGKVRDVNTNEIVAFIVDGNLYSTNGEFWGVWEVRTMCSPAQPPNLS